MQPFGKRGHFLHVHLVQEEYNESHNARYKSIDVSTLFVQEQAPPQWSLHEYPSLLRRTREGRSKTNDSGENGFLVRTGGSGGFLYAQRGQSDSL